MNRKKQKIYECIRCGRTFEDGEDFWYKTILETYCIDCEELSQGELEGVLNG